MDWIINQLDKLATLRPDINKHITIALLWDYVVITAYGFSRSALLASFVILLGLLLAIGWELYNMKKDNKPFSYSDVMAFFGTVLPVAALVLKDL